MKETISTLHTQDNNTGWLRMYHACAGNQRLMRKLLTSGWHPGRLTDLDAAALKTLGVDETQALALLNALRSHGELDDKVAADLHWQTQPGHHIITLDDERYPPLLGETHDPPLLLYLAGEAGALNNPVVALVGSRNSSHYGRQLATSLSRDLAQAGVTVCSGLAAGIDTAAHAAALQQRAPTIAVLGSGLQCIYPASNTELARRIAEGESGSVLVSEFPLQSQPQPFFFPLRNRVISGLSAGVCVVEASLRSGSLITARLALEQNRLVFAVPGSVNSPGSRGCHRLLREGAALTENAADILTELHSLLQGQFQLQQLASPLAQPGRPDRLHPRLPQGCAALYRRITDNPVSHDSLRLQTGLTDSELSQQLLKLELSGRIAQSGGHWVRQHKTEPG